MRTAFHLMPIPEEGKVLLLYLDNKAYRQFRANPDDESVIYRAFMVDGISGRLANVVVELEDGVPVSVKVVAE